MFTVSASEVPGTFQEWCQHLWGFEEPHHEAALINHSLPSGLILIWHHCFNWNDSFSVLSQNQEPEGGNAKWEPEGGSDTWTLSLSSVNILTAHVCWKNTLFIQLALVGSSHFARRLEEKQVSHGHGQYLSPWKRLLKKLNQLQKSQGAKMPPSCLSTSLLICMGH